MSAAVTSVDTRVQALSAVSCRAFSASGSATTSVKGLQSVINRISNTFSNAFSAGSVLSGAITSINNILSVTGNVRPDVKFRSNVTSVVSAGTPVDLAGMSVSMAASALYQVQGAVMWEKGTSGGVAFGASLPALGAAGTYLRAWAQSIAPSQNMTEIAGYVAMSAVAAGNTMVVSVSATATNVLRYMKIEGMVATSAAGTMQLMARGSVAADSLSVRGGYLKAYRIY